MVKPPSLLKENISFLPVSCDKLKDNSTSSPHVISLRPSISFSSSITVPEGKVVLNLSGRMSSYSM